MIIQRLNAATLLPHLSNSLEPGWAIKWDKRVILKIICIFFKYIYIYNCKNQKKALMPQNLKSKAHKSPFLPSYHSWQRNINFETPKQPAPRGWGSLAEARELCGLPVPLRHLDASVDHIKPALSPAKHSGFLLGENSWPPHLGEMMKHPYFLCVPGEGLHLTGLPIESQKNHEKKSLESEHL